MRFRPGTQEDLRRFHSAVPKTAKVIAAERDGEVIGVGGFYYDNGAAVVFSGFCDGLSKREIVKGARAIMDMAKGVRGPLYAVQEPNERAARTLAHFGFVPLADGGWWVRP